MKINNTNFIVWAIIGWVAATSWKHFRAMFLAGRARITGFFGRKNINEFLCKLKNNEKTWYSKNKLINLNLKTILIQ